MNFEQIYSMGTEFHQNSLSKSLTVEISHCRNVTAPIHIHSFWSISYINFLNNMYMQITFIVLNFRIKLLNVFIFKMPTTITFDSNDPYFIPSVPMYRDFRMELNLDDSIGDRFFEVLEQPSPKILSVPVEPVIEQKPMITRSTVSTEKALDVFKTQTKPVNEQFVPKVQAKPRPVSRRSLSQTVEQTPAIVQPPMRFGNTSRRSVVAAKGTSNVVTASTMPMLTRSSVSAVKAPPADVIKTHTVPATEQPVPKVQAKPRPVSRRSLSQSVEQTPTIVQPPMRFGNTLRRSVVAVKGSSNAVTPSIEPITTRSSVSAAKASGVAQATSIEPITTRSSVSATMASGVSQTISTGHMTTRSSVSAAKASGVAQTTSIGPMSTRSSASAAKASGVSHAVRGICVVRSTPTKKQQTKDKQ